MHDNTMTCSQNLTPIFNIYIFMDDLVKSISNRTTDFTLNGCGLTACHSSTVSQETQDLSLPHVMCLLYSHHLKYELYNETSTATSDETHWNLKTKKY